MKKRIAFLGAGSIAEAIISGLVKAEIVPNEHIYVTNRSNIKRLEEMENRYEIVSMEDKEKAVNSADIVVLAMKPYDLHDSLQELKSYITENKLIISILAGVSTEAITKELAVNSPVVRVMPNTSAMIGHSATALAKGEYADEEHLKLAETLFNTIGTTTIVDEKDMHAVTAISGSGPAYFYYMVEAMERAAIEAGMDQDIAKQLITQTVIGAGAMLQQSGEPADVLRKKITSPNGTTEAGIHVLEENHMHKILMQCVKSAKERSEELGEE
ncbi:pyrroline-5-carboxylate reductase [Oceanobacillus senegalensis]|uniref:pyrroline-5-carboxylate reductase n=1 Tax=Oceanobacillus senegalensis TaxID=1936063 RepID=UPI000A309FEF|nr:pyrroline-5-carboxylate reductase [Oceanobacillus senegalensis]